VARFLLRRAGLAVLTLLLISITVFVVSELLPGDVARHILGQSATPENVAVLRREMGLDRPPIERYGTWLIGFVTGNWGQSLSLKVPLRPLVLERLKNSLILAAMAFVVIVPVSITFGTIAGMNRGKFIDRTISLLGLSSTAVPEFVSGVLLILVFSLMIPLFPSNALLPEDAQPLPLLHSLVLPSVALMLTLFGYISQMTRASTVSVSASDYVRTARLKGLSNSRVMFRHVLRNALLPTIGVLGTQIGWLIGGLAVIETLFGYPGIGSLLLNGALNKDVPLMETCVMLVASGYMIANLLADLTYGYLNPRIRFS
jgi:peptide/nickel transport system permease protein